MFHLLLPPSGPQKSWNKPSAKNSILLFMNLHIFIFCSYFLVDINLICPPSTTSSCRGLLWGEKMRKAFSNCFIRIENRRREKAKRRKHGKHFSIFLLRTFLTANDSGYYQKLIRAFFLLFFSLVKSFPF